MCGNVQALQESERDKQALPENMKDFIKFYKQFKSCETKENNP